VTTLALVLAVLALAIVFHERRRQRALRRWLAERDRLERYGEHIAAANGHPDGHVLSVWPVVNGHDHPTDPEEYIS
jgi:hypothetical protein